jgi:signal transduction histidine kinase
VRAQGENIVSAFIAARVGPPRTGEAACDPAACAARLVATEQRLRSLAYELTVAEARERERIALGLHDDIGQILAMVRYKLAELGVALGLPPDSPATGLLDEAQVLVRQASDATRSATFDLHSPVLRQLGFKTALESLAQRVNRSGGLRVSVAGEMPPLPLPEPVLSVVFRVVRELLFNVQKHAGARVAMVSLGGSARRWELRVSDDGCGFAVAARRCGPEGGYGLVSAEAQMQAVGGALEILSAPGQGTCATVTLPQVAFIGTEVTE